MALPPRPPTGGLASVVDRVKLGCQKKATHFEIRVSVYAIGLIRDLTAVHVRGDFLLDHRRNLCRRVVDKRARCEKRGRRSLP